MANPQEILVQNVQKAHSIVAQFVAEVVKFVISATAADGGSIDPAGDVEVDQGGTQRFVATPNAGFACTGVLADGEFIPAPADGSAIVITD